MTCPRCSHGTLSIKSTSASCRWIECAYAGCDFWREVSDAEYGSYVESIRFSWCRFSFDVTYRGN